MGFYFFHFTAAFDYHSYGRIGRLEKTVDYTNLEQLYKKKVSVYGNEWYRVGWEIFLNLTGGIFPCDRLDRTVNQKTINQVCQAQKELLDNTDLSTKPCKPVYFQATVFPPQKAVILIQPEPTLDSARASQKS